MRDLYQNTVWVDKQKDKNMGSVGEKQSALQTSKAGASLDHPRTLHRTVPSINKEVRSLSSYLFQIIGNFGIQLIGRGRVGSFRIRHGGSLVSSFFRSRSLHSVSFFGLVLVFRKILQILIMTFLFEA